MATNQTMTPHTEQTYPIEQLTYVNEIEPVYLVEPSRFLWLSLSSFGVYTLWWCYKTYRFFHEKDDADGNAALKTIFNLFFLLSLFKNILRFAKDSGYTTRFNPLVWYVLVVVPGIFSFLPLPFFFLLSLLSYTSFLQPLKAFNYSVSQSVEIRAYTETRLRTAQTVMIVVGAGMWIILIAGTLLNMYQ